MAPSGFESVERCDVTHAHDETRRGQLVMGELLKVAALLIRNENEFHSHAAALCALATRKA